MNSAPDNVFAKVTHHILSNYEPAKDLAEASVTMSTIGLYNGLQSLYPSNTYDAMNIAVLMEDNDFICKEVKPMQPEWLLKKKKQHHEGSS